MWIRNFDIDDFGCFKRARLLDLDNGLTVISGPQRAGKTTFMQAMRKLGYGINRGDDIPPENEEYQLAADIVHDGQECDISVKGYADPRVFSSDGSVEVNDLYGSVSADQYRQLFTITLDQLRRTPPGIDDRKELSAILLGAGYGEIAQIPEIKSDLSSQAADIGGKHGRAVYDMGDPMETIERGIEDREAAKAQVDEHRDTSETLAEVEYEISDLDNAKRTLELEKARLTTVDAVYENFEDYRRLSERLEGADAELIDSFPLDELERAERLADNFDQAIEELEEARASFEEAIDASDTEQHRDDLLALGDDIVAYTDEISGWDERKASIVRREEDLEAEWDDLSQRAGSLHHDWVDDPESVLELPLDAVAEDRLTGIADDYADAKRRLEEAKDAIEDREAKLERTKSNLEEESGEAGEADETSRAVTLTVGLSVVGVIAGLGAGLLSDPLIGLGVMGGIVGIAVVYGYLTLIRGDEWQEESAVPQLKTEVNRLESEIESFSQQVTEAQGDLEAAEEELDAVTAELDLPGEVSADGLEAYYRDLVSLQRDVHDAKSAEADLERDRTALEDELRAVSERVEAVVDLDGFVEDPVAEAASLFAELRRLEKEYELAEELHGAEEDVNSLRDDATAVLESWEDADVSEDASPDYGEVLAELRAFIEAGHEVAELAEAADRHADLEDRLASRFDRPAIVEAFEPIQEDVEQGEYEIGPDAAESETSWLFAAVAYVIDQHVDQSAIGDAIEEVESEIQGLDEERTELIERKADLENELEDLASDEDLKDAQETIERGRQRLVPLAEEYAELRIAEYLIDELHERFIERATGPLLEEASELFAQITNEYNDLDHTGSLDDLDFKAFRDDGTVHTSNELSRATAEQLFLAVRIARIRQLDVNLPVVLDDSMTNFDPNHLGRTIDLVDELAESNQVFFLTCHPEFIEMVSDRASVSQYWNLVDGTFDGPHDDTAPLLEALD